ncbi:hypothetical protein ACFTAO_23260 [Paenibacillus rhizoplanae]
MAVKLLTEIRSRMQVELTLRELLIASTVANMATELDDAAASPLSETGSSARVGLPEFIVSPEEAFEPFSFDRGADGLLERKTDRQRRYSCLSGDGVCRA